MSVWAPFGESARQAIVKAQEASRALGTRVIANEHIVIGVLEAPDNIGATVLREFGLTGSTARDGLRRLSDSHAAPADGDFVFTVDAKNTIEGAFEEARKLDHKAITTGHLILAIASAAPKGNPLVELGIDPDVLRDRLIAALIQKEPQHAIDVFVNVPIPTGGEDRARWFYYQVLGLKWEHLRFTETSPFVASQLAFGITSQNRDATIARIRSANFEVEEPTGRAIACDPFGNTIELA